MCRTNVLWKNRREGGGLFLLGDFNIHSLNIYSKFHHQRLFACFFTRKYILRAPISSATIQNLPYGLSEARHGFAKSTQEVASSSLITECIDATSCVEGQTVDNCTTGWSPSLLYSSSISLSFNPPHSCLATYFHTLIPSIICIYFCNRPWTITGQQKKLLDIGQQ